MTVAGALLLAAYVNGTMPESERLAKLLPHFAPRPGAVVEIEARERRDSIGRVDPAKLRTLITVTPPKGTCFTITRSDDLPDEEICKRTAIAVPLAELDRFGRITWTVKTGNGDWGTELTWRTPYRVAKVVPFDAPENARPQLRWIGSCEAVSTPSQGRKVDIALLDGGHWILRLPEYDQQLPQPRAIPNLAVVTGPAKVSVKDAQAKKDVEATGTAQQGEHETPAHAEAPAPGATPAHGEAPPPPPPKKPDVVPDQEDDRAIWSIPRRGAFEMNAAAFQPDGSVAGRIKGKCRYLFEGPPEDPGTGRVECFETSGFREVTLPLTCLGPLKRPHPDP